VIRTFEKIQAVIPSKLLMVGDGPERAADEQLCRNLGIGDHVRFLGKQDAIEEILSVSDLFLMPSESESFGLAALEAMACKVPAITSNAGGLPELNINGFCGYMSNVGDVDDMAAKAISILSDDAVLKQFKENALIRAKDFDLKKILPLYVDYYNKVIQEQLKLNEA
jgi:N-acetyl-alpha-D-glucosaminyl L-malate synthase BshA